MRALRLPLPPPRLLLTPRLLAVLVLVLLALAWAAGFAWFLHVAVETTEPPPPADGIVALTGGAERVETALHLLAGGRARLLLVSGVGGATEFNELAHRAGVPASLAARVTLGRAAASTHGNAAETAAWVRENAIRSLIVVTAGYHMPRALAELGRTLPGVTLYPVSVLPPALRGARGAATLRLLAGEYTKWLAAEVGLTALMSRVEQRGHAQNPAHPNVEHRGG
jgi:uncharacterized SAM-binding protein YcdF (DUF218 family)